MSVNKRSKPVRCSTNDAEEMNGPEEQERKGKAVHRTAKGARSPDGAVIEKFMRLVTLNRGIQDLGSPVFPNFSSIQRRFLSLWIRVDPKVSWQC